MPRFLLVVLSLLVSSPAFPLTATVSIDSLQVSGATPGSDIVVVGIARINQPYTVRFTEHNVVVNDADRDGAATVPLLPSTLVGVWVVVDAASGAYATVQSADVHGTVRVITQESIRDGVDGPLSALVMGRPLINALLVRPGVGAWRVTAGDGAQFDSDLARNASVTLKMRDLRRLRQEYADAPVNLRRNDTVAVIDGRTLDIYVGRVIQ